MKKRILFICSGNTCRSPMAEGIMRSKILRYGLNDRYEILSAGLCVMSQAEANPKSIYVCEANGINITSHQAKQIDEFMVLDSALILTMTLSHKLDIMNKMPHASSKIYTLKEYAAKFSTMASYESLDIIDPYGSDISVYHDTFHLIDHYINIITQNLNL